MTDKRKEERISKNIKSEVQSEESMTYSTSVDWSSGGVFISTPEPLHNGSEVSMSIKVNDEVELEVKGTVKWVRSEESPDGRAGMGIQFKDLDLEKEEIISRLIK